MDRKANKILVVDSDASSLMFLDVNLSKFGYEILTAESTEKGLLLANRERPDLVVCDIHSTNMDGIEFCWMIRETSHIAGVPFILLTPSENPETHIQAYRSGVDAIVQKPVSIRTLLTRIETLLRRFEQIRHMAPAESHHLENEGPSHPPDLQGSLQAISLIELIQFLNMAKKSGTIQLIREDQQGNIGFKEGEVVYASTRDTTGEEAVYRMAGWQDGMFRFRAGEHVETTNIQKSTMKLILDCCKLLDMEAIIVQSEE